MSLLDILEQELASTEHDRAHNQSQFIHNASAQQAGHQCRAAHGVHVLARMLLHRADVFNAVDDARVVPGRVLERLRQHDGSCGVSEPGVGASPFDATLPVNGNTPSGLARMARQDRS